MFANRHTLTLLVYILLLALALALPNSLVCLHQHRPISPWDWHGIVAYVDLTATQQHLTADLQPLVQDGQ